MVGHGSGRDVRKSRKFNCLAIAGNHHTGVARNTIYPNTDVSVGCDGELLGSYAKLFVFERKCRHERR
jgi:hypothetical protein